MCVDNYQAKLFDAPQRFENGLVYRPEFITPEEEELLLVMIEHAPLRPMKYEIKSSGESIMSRRRAAWFAAPLPRWLTPLQTRIAKWLDVPKHRVGSALINEYLPGTGMGFHRDDGDIEHVVGVSLRTRATMRFRPYEVEKESDIISLDMEPCSAYIMQGDVRWRYQHSVLPVKDVRYSITFRTVPPS